jgi:superfamily II DNA or RNA helicase
MLEHRDYQDRVVHRVIGHFEAGDRTVMIESPTGSGKTIMGLRVLQHFERDRGLRANWVSMRRNLLAQVTQANERFFGLRNLRVVSMFDPAPPPADITVVDEAQHDAAASCIHIHEASRSRFILGMSATPYRTDTLKLAFKRVVKDAGLHRLIQDGWLCPYQHWAIEEYSVRSVSETYLREPDRWGKCVVFLPTVLDCHFFALRLAMDHHHCEVVSAETDREAQLDAFDRGEFNVVANVAILNEGFDCPDLQTVFVRDASRLPTIQMAGRGFRRAPGKTHCNIVQSVRAGWQFTRTARPQSSHARRDNRWLSLEGSDVVDRTVSETARRIAVVDVRLPAFLTRKRGRKAIWPAAPGRTSRGLPWGRRRGFRRPQA